MNFGGLKSWIQTDVIVLLAAPVSCVCVVHGILEA